MAWHPLGWQASFFSEIEAFPRAVLQHRHPHVPLHGDFTTIQEHDYDPIDLLVGGTPCQAFSVAGLRKGFADERGNLTLEFIRLAQRLKPQWLVWENVPGVLSIDGGRAFGAFLGGLAELGYGFAYRVLDAQHFGVPQRRRRVFVVGYSGDWRPAAAVLFERESLLWNLTPSREKGESVTHDVAPSLTSSGRGVERTGESRGQDPVIPCLWDGSQISQTLNAVLSKGQAMPEKNRFPAVLQPVTPPLTGNPYGDHESRDGLLVTHSLRGEGFDASEDGTGRGTPLVPVAVLERLSGTQCVRAENISPSLRTTNPTAVAFAQNTRDELREMPYVGALAAEPGMKQTSYIRTAMQVRRLTPRECERLQGFPDDYTLVPNRGKPAADGPRYKALGNSMAVPCMRWIGERIEIVRALQIMRRAS